MAGIRFEQVTKVFAGAAAPAVDTLSLEVADGEFVILVGPSGCGKTTALRMVAGLERPTSGRVWIGERDVTEVSPRDRDVAMVFQNYALYPHMTVYRNLAFGLRQRKVPKPEIERRVREAGAMLGLDDLLKRRPAQLSGGQRQRVAMGRALVREPAAFLLDEPLSNLDAKLRVQMRAELKRIHTRLGVTTLYVTHDQLEAMTLGDRIAVMSEGNVQQIGTPTEIYERPTNLFVAAFIGSPGMNLVAGTAAGGRVTAGDLVVEAPGAPDGEVVVGVRPESLWPAIGGELNGRPYMECLVEVVESLGDSVMVRGTVDGQRASVTTGEEALPLLGGERTEVVARLARGASPVPGDRLRFVVPLEEVHIFDAASGERVRWAEARGAGAEGGSR